MRCHAPNRRFPSLSVQFRALAIAATICASASSTMAADDRAPHLARVRSENSYISDLVREATTRSTTFRHLVDAIDATDGLVYIEQGKCGHSVRACLLISVNIAGPYRILRIRVTDIRPSCRLMASIAHELRHAIEALSESSVRSNSAIYSFFQHEGPTDSGRFETEAAMHAGLDVDAQCGRY